MKNAEILNVNYLDIIFFNRNKSYGAYALRKNYANNLIKSFLILLCITILSILSFVNFSSKKNTIYFTKPIEPFRISKVDLTKPKLLAKKSGEAKPTKHTKTKSNISKAMTFKIVETAFIDTTSIVDYKNSTKSNSSDTTSGEEITGNGGKKNGLGNEIEGENENFKPLRYVTEMPNFIGSINVYLEKNLKYPELAKQSSIQGKVIVEFIVTKIGKVKNARIIKGIGGGCDEEAIAVISNMPNWKPGMQNGQAVDVYFTIPIFFSLN